MRGHLASGADAVLAAYELRDIIGQLQYKVWYYPSLMYDADQRDNAINARRQQVQILFAQLGEASAWFEPELLQIPLSTVQQWMTANSRLGVYRFAIEDLYRPQAPTLPAQPHHLPSSPTP